jgi:hypothetical protein
LLVSVAIVIGLYVMTRERALSQSSLALSDAELLDLTLAAALFSALAIIEPLCAAVAPIPIDGTQRLEPTRISSVL